jgi:hypothetical protein
VVVAQAAGTHDANSNRSCQITTPRSLAATN